MKRRHSHLERAIRMLAPLINMADHRRIRARARSRARIADIDLAAPWFRANNVVGILVSPKISGRNRQRNELSLKFLVRRKLPRSRLSAAELIPPRLTLQSVGREIITDVEAVSSMPAVHGASDRVRPVVPGCSIGHPRAGGGTLGLVVKKGTDDCYLSCAHVLAPGGEASSHIDDPIEQPDDLFGSAAENVIASLAKFTDVSADSMDAAVAKANTVPHGRAIPHIGIPDDILNFRAADFAGSDLVLIRRGVGSGLQEGTIDGFGAIKFFYSDLGQAVTLNDVVTLNASSAGGDSGAALFVKGTRTVAGMHVGGISDSQSVFFPIQAVFDSLGIMLI